MLYNYYAHYKFAVAFLANFGMEYALLLANMNITIKQDEKSFYGSDGLRDAVGA